MMKKKRIVLILAVLSFLILLVSCYLLDKHLKVRSTIDGDTVILNDGRHVRLIGVNTSEMNYGKPLPPEAYAVEARNFVDSIATRQKCYLEQDPVGDKVDRFGRTLAYVFILPDSTFLNAEIIRYGYSKVYDKFPFRKDYKKLFYKLQDEARREKRGIWQ